jgi:CheY-like chemotaxis protein
MYASEEGAGGIFMKKIDKNVAHAKLLVLDDEQDIVDIFSSLMRQLGYDADFFKDGSSAIEAITRNPDLYDIVITDIKMPNIDGISFAKRIRILCPRLPIIFMTGYPSDDIKKEALQLKKVAFLEKPFHLEKTFGELIPKLLSDSEN